jgi:hypothetical protein
LLIILARSSNSVGLFSDPQSKFRKKEIGSTVDPISLLLYANLWRDTAQFFVFFPQIRS